MLVGKIDLNKVDKNKLFAGKNGAQYLDVILVETPNSQYGDSHMIVQSVSKEEREAGVKGVILGNAKTLAKRDAAPPASNFVRAAQPPVAPAPAPTEDVPY